MINNVAMEFKVLADGDVRETGGGTVVGNAFVVCDRSKKTDGGWEKAGEWKGTLIGWRDTGEIVGSLTKGDKVVAIGRVETREYNEKIKNEFTAMVVGVVPTKKKAKPADSGDDDLPF